MSIFENFLSENTKICVLLRDDMITTFDKNGEIEKNRFEENLKEFEEISTDSYNTNDEDIEDLGDILMLCNQVMFHILTNKTNLDKYYNIILTRKSIKKLINKKFREVHDFVYSNQINNKKIDRKTKPDETPREIWNCYECEYQYASISRYIWQPSTDKLKQVTESILDKQEFLIELFNKYNKI